MTARKGLLLVNPRAGDERPSAAELAAAAGARDVAVHVLSAGEDPAELAERAQADAIGVAGGDGSLAPVAAVAARRGLPFVCVPFGTRNHFARDLGLERDDPLAALAAFSGVERLVDLARVGERPFLNNVSIGLYAHLVHRRERRRARRQALASARALVLAARQHRTRSVLSVDGSPVAARVLLVANNSYALDVFSIGERKTLDAGLLHLYAASGLLPTSWHERTGTRFSVDAVHSRLRVAIDGEPAQLETPLRFAIEPRALRVLVPLAPGADDVGDAAEGAFVRSR